MIAAACRDRECLRFAYRSRDGTDSRRVVEPHALANLGRRWYLVAWDRDREDWRTFRVDRLSRPATAGARFAPRKLPAKDAAAYVEQSIASAPNRFEARVTLRVSADELVGRGSLYGGDDQADRRAHVRIPRRGRQPRMARAPDSDARRGVRGSRAARADSAPASARQTARASHGRSLSRGQKRIDRHKVLVSLHGRAPIRSRSVLATCRRLGRASAGRGAGGKARRGTSRSDKDSTPWRALTLPREAPGEC